MGEGDVLYHSFIQLTREEVQERKAKREKKRQIRLMRKKQQEVNVQRKQEHKEAHKQRSLEGMKRKQAADNGEGYDAEKERKMMMMWSIIKKKWVRNQIKICCHRRRRD